MKFVVKKILFIEDIQYLRAFAVLSVIFFHLEKQIFPNGYLGVDVFFVVSGFLISNIVYSDIYEGNFQFRKFYINRIRRIVPSLISVLLFSQVLAFFTLDSDKVISVSKGAISSLFFVSNVYFSQLINYFDGDSSFNLLINLWSLSVEEQFYLLFPVLLFLIHKKTKKTQIVILFSIFSISFFSFFSNYFYSNFYLLNKIFFNYSNFIFYSPLTRVWEFFLGIFFMLLYNNFQFRSSRSKEFFKYLLWLILFIFLFTDLLIFRENYRLIFVNFLTGLIILLSGTYKNRIGYLKNFLLHVGAISYSLYLFHQPVIAALRNHNYNTSPFGIGYFNFDSNFNLLILLLVIYIISLINYQFVETNLRNIESFKKNYFLFFSSTLLILTFFYSLAFITDGYEFRHEKSDLKPNRIAYNVKTGTNFITIDNNTCINKDLLEQACKFGSGKKEIYLFGDSLVSSLTSGFLEKEILENYKLVEYTKASCPLLINYCNFSVNQPMYDEVSKIKDSIIILGGDYEKFFIETEINVIQGTIYLDSTINNSKQDLFEEDLKKTIEIFTKNNNRVFLINTMPKPFMNLKMYYFVNREDLLLDAESYFFINNSINEIVKKISDENFNTIDLRNVFCEKDFCKFYDNENYFFYDQSHVGYFGAKKIVRYILNKNYFSY